MESILSENQDKCFLCGKYCKTHRHHIYFGGNRQASEKNGFVVYLCPQCHNMSDNGVHFNHEIDLHLKRVCQRKFEETHSRQEFMKIIGRNYL